MFKYREIRMLLVTSLIFIMVNGLVVYALVNKNKMQIALGLIMSFSSLLLLATRYKMAVFNDSVMVYEFKGVAILPVLIEFDKIERLELVGKHRLNIVHGTTTKVYIVDATRFIDEIELSRKVYKGLK
ncbi:MAG: hypothetical protein PHI41_02790 [Erysipelotrichaceae bacterium]|nr:hypothetical protein [Erysipelotrichaceae bacterium]MDD3809252.1 hypothetical protein [Erysipelotrichaceae bacterium]